MTKLLDQAIMMIRELPEDAQDAAARQLMRYVDEISTAAETAETVQNEFPC